MGDIGFSFPESPPTNITTQTSEPSAIRFEPIYIRTPPGWLKCIQTVLNFIIFLIISISYYANKDGLSGTSSFMELVSGMGFWITGVLLLLFLFRFPDKYFTIPWLIIEFFYCGIYTVIFLVGSTMCMVLIHVASVYGLVAVLGYIDMLAYGYDCFIKYKGIQETRGEHVIFKISPRA